MRRSTRVRARIRRPSNVVLQRLDRPALHEARDMESDPLPAVADQEEDRQGEAVHPGAIPTGRGTLKATSPRLEAEEVALRDHHHPDLPDPTDPTVELEHRCRWEDPATDHQAARRAARQAAHRQAHQEAATMVLMTMGTPNVLSRRRDYCGTRAQRLGYVVRTTTTRD